MPTVESFTVTPLDASFGARIEGVRLATIDDAAFARLYRTWLDYGLLVFPGQHLTQDEQVAFARRLGELEIEIVPISNVRRDGTVRADVDSDEDVKVLKGNMGWHCDSTYMPVQAKGAVFTAHVVPPEGGETGFVDMRAAYDALDPAMKARIADLSAYHSLHYSQAKVGHEHKEGSAYGGYGFQVKDPPLRPLVKINPETGRPALMIGRHSFGVASRAAEESDRLLDERLDSACRPPPTSHHP